MYVHIWTIGEDVGGDHRKVIRTEDPQDWEGRSPFPKIGEGRCYDHRGPTAERQMRSRKNEGGFWKLCSAQWRDKEYLY